MYGKLKKIKKYCLIFAIWIFCLSVRIGDKTVFDHAHGIIVDNKIVSAIDEELTGLWERIFMTARITYGRMSASELEDDREG